MTTRRKKSTSILFVQNNFEVGKVDSDAFFTQSILKDCVSSVFKIDTGTTFFSFNLFENFFFSFPINVYPRAFHVDVCKGSVYDGFVQRVRVSYRICVAR